MEDLIAGGKKLTLAPLPDLALGGRDVELHRDRSRTDLKAELAREGLEKKEVFVELDKDKLDAALVKLYRQARADLNEGGSNTLFLALGFLEWKKKASDERAYRAPLILQPVRLERRNARSGMKLTAHDDDPRFNMTLLELLKQDFGMRIPGLDGELPSDESGIDVTGIWNRVRRAIAGTPGFEVREQVVLGIFSFSKYLMWKDLVDRRDLLKQNRVVAHLIERGKEPFAANGPLPRPEDLDVKVDPADLYAPLPADSSQLAAVVAAGEGHDFVLDGPPGTGKSQTIANMIAQNLALGRRVLFVSEKRAALDVVYRRLEQVGLGDFCLELHSHKSAKIEVLRQLERAWNARGALASEEWATKTRELKTLRDALNGFAAAMHRRHDCGLTVHDAVWRVVRDGDDATPVLRWPPQTRHAATEVDAMRQVVRRLELTHTPMERLPDAITHHVNAREWSNSWQAALLSAAMEYRDAAREVAEAAQATQRTVALPLSIDSPLDARRLATLCEALAGATGLNLAFAFRPDHLAANAALRDLAQATRTWNECRSRLSADYADPASAESAQAQLEQGWTAAEGKIWPLKPLAQWQCKRALSATGNASGDVDPGQDLGLLAEMAGLRERAERASEALSDVAAARGLDSDPELLEEMAASAEALRTAIRSQASDPHAFSQLIEAARALVVDANEMLGPDTPFGLAATTLAERIARFEEAEAAFVAAGGGASSPSDFAAIAELCDAIAAHAPQLNALCQWNAARMDAEALGLEPVIHRVVSGLPDGEAVPLFETAYAKWFAPWAIDADTQLSQFHSASHEDAIRRFRDITEEVQKLTAGIIRARLCSGLPDQSGVARASGYGILKHELAKQRAHKPVRQLAEEMGPDFSALAPCMLMSPLSIAQYLPATQELFDIVIFDEASQITPWDAVGSIGRGRQLVLAGDQKQMPPTNFFSRGSASVDEDTLEDLDSILDECVSAAIPRRSLDWHYRSRHDSLIAFSNSRYYDNRLVTFPAPETRDSAVEWHRVDGVYGKGSEQTNVIEAQAIVAEAKRRLQGKAPGETTLGIVTLNSKQQELIEDLLERARRADPAFDAHFADELEEPVFVKNLETVQGDERDTIILGITFGPVERGGRKMSMNFGPLNRDGGWRRLNVAVTRARSAMLLFTSFDAGMIDLSRTSAQAVRDLKHYIEFAERGPRALAEAHLDSIGGTESPFEDAVKARLERRGWSVRPQIGVSGYRIDLGIVHPDHPGDFLAGVECDGAMYHSALTARDRDKVRQAVLEGLGWRIYRIWSTDFWIDADGAMDRVHTQLETALAEDRERRGRVSPIVETEAALEQASEASDPSEEDGDQSLDEGSRTPQPRPTQPPLGDNLAAPAPLFARATAVSATTGAIPYRHTDFSPFEDRIEPARFHDAGYDETLRELIGHVVRTEAPIRKEQLATAIARAHGFARTGRLIRKRINRLAWHAFPHLEDAGGLTFVWTDSAAVGSLATYRVTEDGASARPIDQIALQELRLAGDAVGAADDAAVAVARLFGIGRLAQDARARIELALRAEPAGSAA